VGANGDDGEQCGRALLCTRRGLLCGVAALEVLVPLGALAQERGDRLVFAGGDREAVDALYEDLGW
jgi:hypothetical protein